MPKLILESSLDMLVLDQAVLSDWHQFKEDILPVVSKRVPELRLSEIDYARVYSDGSVVIFCPHSAGEVSKSFPPKTFG